MGRDCSENLTYPRVLISQPDRLDLIALLLDTLLAACVLFLARFPCRAWWLAVKFLDALVAAVVEVDDVEAHTCGSVVVCSFFDSRFGDVGALDFGFCLAGSRFCKDWLLLGFLVVGRGEGGFIGRDKALRVRLKGVKHGFQVGDSWYCEPRKLHTRVIIYTKTTCFIK